MSYWNPPPHITIIEGGPDRYDIQCMTCGGGVKGGRSFGPVSGADMAASFIAQHTVHTKSGVPSGLTSSGNPSKAFRAYIPGGPDAA